MTSLLNVLSRQTFAFVGCDTAVAPRGRAAQGTGDAEYQAVFATTALLLAGGVAVVFTALAHAF